MIDCLCGDLLFGHIYCVYRWRFLKLGAECFFVHFKHIQELTILLSFLVNFVSKV